MGNILQPTKRRETAKPPLYDPMKNISTSSLGSKVGRNKSLNSYPSTPVLKPPEVDPLLEYFDHHSLSPTNIITDGTRFMMQNHYLIRELFKTNYMGISSDALRNGAKVLDAANGNLDIGDGAPVSKVAIFRLGMDLAYGPWPDTQLLYGTRSGKIVDTESLRVIPFPNDVFDYVHEQVNLFVTSEKDWSRAINEMARVLKPGGYIDLIEIDTVPNLPPDALPAAARFISQMIDNPIQVSGIDWHIPTQMGKFVEESQLFTEIQLIRRTIPIGWDSELGVLFRYHFQASMLAIMPILAQKMPSGNALDPREYGAFCQTYFDACANANAYCKVFRVTARKK
ncbi:hypothetical protein BJ742DRAFT_886048 [Cladochytrium replicatum]|nr:hypothetical protein BJ742DRAFT_886048 [Cladochytrium replicatum]